MKLYEAITAKNWVKGSSGTWSPGNGPACLGTHFFIVYGYDCKLDGWELLENAIRLLHPERSPNGCVVKFNDHPDTTLEDVIRVCKVADV